MKKFMAFLLTVTMICLMTACGGQGDSSSASNEITEMLDNGYIYTMTSSDENHWKGIFQQGDSYDTVYMVSADMTEEQYEELSSIEFDDENYDAKVNAVLGKLQNVTVTDITDKVPSQDELDVYIGKTIGDLENEGFENSGWSGDEELGYAFYYDGPVYCCSIIPAEGTVIENMDDLSANDIRAIKIGKVQFLSLSGSILD